MIKKNITVTIIHDEEQILHLKSASDRSYVILEPIAPKITVSLEEIHEAFRLVEAFSIDNPADEEVTPVDIDSPDFKVGHIEYVNDDSIPF